MAWLAEACLAAELLAVAWLAGGAWLAGALPAVAWLGLKGWRRRLRLKSCAARRPMLRGAAAKGEAEAPRLTAP